MKLWIQILIIWGGVLCLAWGAYESDNDQLLHMRGKAFVHTVELLQQVKAKTYEPPTNDIPIKTVSFCPPNCIAVPSSAYNIRGPLSKTTIITPCCAIVFKEPEKTKISSEVFLICRQEGRMGTGSKIPLAIKYPRQESYPDREKAGMAIAFLRTELDIKSLKPVYLSSSRAPISPVDTFSASGFEVQKNLTGMQFQDLKEIAIIAKPAMPEEDNTRLPISLAYADSRFGSLSENNAPIAPIRVDVNPILWKDNSLASLLSISTIGLDKTAFRDEMPSANPILVSYHPENMLDSIGYQNNTFSDFAIHRTLSDVNLAELNEIVLAVAPIVSDDNISPPIKLRHTDNIFDGISENNLYIAPICLNAKSILNASAYSSLICLPAVLKRNIDALGNPASALNPILIPRFSADSFALNKAHAAPIRLNGLKTNTVLSVQIRHIIFASNLAKIPFRNPCTLTLRRSDLTMAQAIDRMLISGIINEVRSGRINKRSPEIRAQLVQFLGDNPLGPTSQQIFSMILENFPGNALRRKIAALQAWAQEYAAGRYAPILGYHIMHQFYRNKDYDAAIQFAESFLEKTKEFNDRVCFLQALCYAQKNNTTAALNVLQKIQHDFPDSPMAPESVFLYAWIFYEDGNLAEAKTILKELTAKYPNSSSAVKAGNLLEAINQKNSLALKP